MTDWAVLRHAYGSAEDVPRLLEAAENAGVEFGPAWDEVWSRLCHQGTVYTASYEALPYLTEIAERHRPAGYVAAVDLASSIVASTDGPVDPVDVRARWATTLGRLHVIAERNLPLAADDTEFIYGLQAVLAFQDAGVWQRHLNHVADGELPLECPHCGELLVLALAGTEPVLANFTDASVAPSRVQPGEPDADSAEGKILTTARSLGRTAVADVLTVVFGGLVCPSCSAPFKAADAYE